MATPSTLEAPPLRLDVSDARAWLGDTPLQLGSKPFEVLRTLMERPERLVTKDELIDIVWRGRPVSDAVLTTAMRDLRRALSDDARAPTFIQTVHGKGYRFLRPVNGPAASSVPASGAQKTSIASFPWFRLGLAVSILVFAVGLFQLGRFFAPNVQHELPPLNDGGIAVLPFADRSPAGDQAYFSEGLADEILTALIAVDGLSVTSRTSSFAYRKRTDASIKDIASALGVRHLLEGAVRREGDTLRVNVQLIDALDDRHIWSNRFERDTSVENLLAIQDEIAAAIVAALEQQLGETLTRRDIRRTSAAAGTQSLTAYEAFLAARELFVDRRDSGQAIDLARRAVEEDPEFARAWELLAASAFVETGSPTGEVQHAVATALHLDSQLSLAQALQGVVGNINPPYDWELAIQRLTRAVELNPKNTTALLWLGLEHRKLGYLDRAESFLDQCLQVDASYHRCRLHRLYSAHMNGKTSKAMEDYRRLVADGHPPDDDILLLAFIAADQDDWAQRVLNSLSDSPPPAKLLEALHSKPVSGAPAMTSALRDWVLSQTTNRRDFYSLIMAFGAYDLLEVEQGSYFGLWLPEFPEYRASNHFKVFVKTMRLDKYWRENGFPPQCHALGDDDFSCE